MKRVFLILIIAVLTAGGVFGQANARRHWVSGEISFAGASARYDYMLASKFSIGANAYINVFVLDFGAVFGFPMDMGIAATGCFYPSGKKFFIELDLGYGSNTPIEWNLITDTDKKTTGFLINPGIGWKFHVPYTQYTNFFFTPGLKVPIVLGNQKTNIEHNEYSYKFGVGLGLVVYCSLGIAF